MKKIAIIIVALLALAMPARAQLTIGEKSEGPKQLAVLQQMWAWLYQLDGRIYFVCKTDNRFDPWMYLDLGTTKDEAAQTVRSLIGALEEAKRGDEIRVQSQGETFLLVYEEILGAKAWMIYPVQTEMVYAGSGPMNMSALRKAVKYLEN